MKDSPSVPAAQVQWPLGPMKDIAPIRNICRSFDPVAKLCGTRVCKKMWLVLACRLCRVAIWADEGGCADSQHQQEQQETQGWHHAHEMGFKPLAVVP